jgi:hypothetical protein
MHRSCQGGVSEDVRAVSLLSPFLLARCFRGVVCWLDTSSGDDDASEFWFGGSKPMHTQEIKIGEILAMNKEIGVTGRHQQHFTGGLLSNQLTTIPP